MQILPAPAETHVFTSRRAHVVIVTGTFLAEAAAIWITARADGTNLWPTVLWVVGIGVVGLVAIFVLDVRFHKRAQKAEAWLVPGERQPSPTYRHRFWLLVGGTIVVLLAAMTWVLPLKMWVAEGGAIRVAQQLIPPSGSSPECSTSPADLNSVGLLISATKVCGYGAPNPTVWFEGHTVEDHSTGDHVVKGVVYAPDGFGENGPVCISNLVGPWWVYQDLILQCPGGFSVAGHSP